MKKTLLAFLLFAMGIGGVYSQPASRTQWFEDARFGMFVHFGPYSVLGNGEWVMNNRPIRTTDYMRLQNLFYPHAFSAKDWVRIAREAGMKYITFTSRHHDGFSNWNTAQSPWNIMNTPYKKDFLAELSAECQREGMKLVLYYSLIDWMRTDYQYETGRTGKGTGRTEPSDWAGYVAFMKAQLTELLTGYGPIAGIWFDGHWDQTDDKNRTDPTTYVDWHYAEIYGLIKQLQPDCLVANNHHLPPFDGEDYQIFERDVPGENEAGHSGQEISRLPLETCQTINGSWGFSITDDRFKSTTELIHLLVRTAGTGANLLLNVGPMPNGEIQSECVDRLRAMGDWMNEYGKTIYGTRMGPAKPQEWGAVTRKGNTYYVHVLRPETTSVELELKGIKSARWLNAGLSDVPVGWTTDRKLGKTVFSFSGTLDAVDSVLEVVVK